MNKQQLNQAFELIETNENIKESVHSKIMEKYLQGESSPKRKKNTSFAGKLAFTAAVLAVLLIPQTIFADEIKDFFTGFLTKNDEIVELVKQNVYEDTDGHLKMAVREVLSDQKYTTVIISYEALDEEGRNWIERFNEQDYRNGIHSNYLTNKEFGYQYQPLSLHPNKHISYSYAFRELKEFRTDSTLAILFEIDVDEPLNLTSAMLSYPMTHEMSRTKTLDISANTDIYEYKLIGDTNVNKYYDVNYVRLTSLSLTIYGNQKNMWEYRKNAADGTYMKSLVPKEDYHSAETKVTLTLKDGTSFDCPYGWQGGILTDSEGNVDTQNHRGADTLIISTAYNDEMLFRENFETKFAINPEEVAGITVNGHYFTLERLN